MKTTKIDWKFISLGNWSRKYISEGKISILNTDDKNTLNFSIFKEKIIPIIIPEIVAKKPIVKPVKKNIFFIDLF